MVFLEILRWYFKRFTDGIFGDSEVVFWRFRGGIFEYQRWFFGYSEVVFLEIQRWHFGGGILEIQRWYF